MARRNWAPSEIHELRERFPTSRIKDLAVRFGVTPVQLSGIAFYYGISRWQIKKVASEKSQLDPFALSEAKHLIRKRILEEPDIEKAKKLEAIYQDLEVAMGIRRKAVLSYARMQPTTQETQCRIWLTAGKDRQLFKLDQPNKKQPEWITLHSLKQKYYPLRSPGSM